MAQDNVINFPATDGPGRGNFFAVDKRTWAKVCELGSINAALTYLVLARGSGGDNRTTSWSANAIEERTNVHWKRAKAAIIALCDATLVRQTKGGVRKRPQYYLPPFHEISGAEPTVEERAFMQALLQKPDRPVPKSSSYQSWGCPKPYAVASGLVKKGWLVEDGRDRFKLRPLSDETPDWVWLPNTLIDGMGVGAAPIELIRQTQNLAAIRLLVDLYHVQSLDQNNGVSHHHLFQSYEREKVGENGIYVLWGFRGGSTKAWGHRSPAKEHLTGIKGPDGVDAGWPIFWKAIELLGDLGLIEFVPHVIDSDGPEGEILHPYGSSNLGEPGEQAVAVAAHQAAYAMLNPGKAAGGAVSGLWLLPSPRHMANVQMVGIARLKHRARTTATSKWVSRQEDWDCWAEQYGLREAEARSGVRLGVSDIKGRSK